MHTSLEFDSTSLQKNELLWVWRVQTHSDRADIGILKALESELRSSSSTPTFPNLTRTQLQRLMNLGHVTADGVPLKANSKLKAGMEVKVEFPAPTPTTLTPENRPIHLLYEDEHLLVLNKPPGLTVHPSSTQPEGTLVHALLHHIKNLSGIGGVLRPGIVHRIDKNTSGALVITKTDLAHTGLAAAFSKHAIERTYWALCYGVPPQYPSKIESLIGRSPADRKKMSMTVKSGKKAVTHFKIKEKYGLPHKRPFASWLEVTLETGRTHQVRVHLTGIGHSLLGDPVYGTPSENQPKWRALPDDVRQVIKTLSGQALHARVLGFIHPITGQMLRFEADPPETFSDLQKSLARYSDFNSSSFPEGHEPQF